MQHIGIFLSGVFRVQQLSRVLSCVQKLVHMVTISKYIYTRPTSGSIELKVFLLDYAFNCSAVKSDFESFKNYRFLLPLLQIPDSS